MKNRNKSLTFYTLMILLFGSFMYLIIHLEEKQHTPDDTIASAQAPENIIEGYHAFSQLLIEQIQSPFGLLLMQIIVILLICRIFGWIFNKMGQPAVIGEITAGIFLGPSLLGHFFPDISSFLFPLESLSRINLLSQFGLILFMYVIGMELDINEVKKKFQETLSISHTSIALPFVLGVGTAFFIYDTYAYQETPFLPFALFIGIAMSITAFPVLARIIQEKKMTRTHLGTLALASAANGDITAWCMLAAVVAIAQAGSMLSAVYNILLAAVYLLIMFYIVRPVIRMIGNLYHNREVVDKYLITMMFMLLILSSFITEVLGLHALFGAFVVGVIMPDNLRFRKIMSEKVEDVALILFLPLFFVSTGLRTEIGLLNSPEMWKLCGIFILIAIAGKMGGSILSARFAGESWKDSLLLGGLMNTRGLMELIVLTIGYELKILPPAIFVMLVIMTLVTTFMTTPLLSFINFCYRTGEKIVKQRQEAQKEGRFKVLLSFGRAVNGRTMLDVAHQMFTEGENKLDLTALHLTVGSDINPVHTESFEQDSFSPILNEAQKLNIQIQTRYEVTHNAGQRIVDIANNEPYDFLLVGAGISLSNLSTDISARKIYQSFFRFIGRINSPTHLFFPNALIHDKTKMFIEQANCSVGIFVNRSFVKATEIILIINAKDDLFLLNYATTLIKSTKGKVSILNRTNHIPSENELIHDEINDFVARTTDSIVLSGKELQRESFTGQNFLLISYATWNKLSVECEEALKDMPSTLIIKHGR
ncbi:MAG: cation:proton antiporter [Tannerella sp.]|jgi:Kef-type K+ transport system membrane component KefB|nr:cation:proton antiporter [Tannerella sp.]